MADPPERMRPPGYGRSRRPEVGIRCAESGIPLVTPRSCCRLVYQRHEPDGHALSGKPILLAQNGMAQQYDVAVSRTRKSTPAPLNCTPHVGLRRGKIHLADNTLHSKD
jgi:hypothetical protein